MAQYIPKDALVTEIKKRQKEHDEKKYDYASSDHFWASVEDGKILSLIDTLEVKEILSLQEEPVSKELGEAAKNHAVERFRTTRDRELAEKCKWSFKAGASWKKEEMMRDAVDAFIYKGNIRLKEWPLPEKYGKHLDSVKLIIIKKNKNE